MPGKSAESLLIRLVSGLEADRIMPAKGPRLTAGTNRHVAGLDRPGADLGSGIYVSPRARRAAAPAASELAGRGRRQRSQPTRSTCCWCPILQPIIFPQESRATIPGRRSHVHPPRLSGPCSACCRSRTKSPNSSPTTPPTSERTRRQAAGRQASLCRALDDVSGTTRCGTPTAAPAISTAAERKSPRGSISRCTTTCRTTSSCAN